MFDSLSSRFDDIFTRLRSRGRLSEKQVDEVLREIRLALLEADVNHKVVKDFTARVRERAMGQDVLKSVTPGQQVVRTEIRNAVFLPKQLQIRGTLDTELRTRGIFSVPVYKLALTVDGEFDRPRLADRGSLRGARAANRRVGQHRSGGEHGIAFDLAAVHHDRAEADEQQPADDRAGHRGEAADDQEREQPGQEQPEPRVVGDGLDGVSVLAKRLAALLGGGQGLFGVDDLGEPVGSEPGFRRPVVVVQGDDFNRSALRTVVAVSLTSNLRWASAPGNVRLTSRATGLPRDSVANVSRIVTLDIGGGLAVIIALTYALLQSAPVDLVITGGIVVVALASRGPAALTESVTVTTEEWTTWKEHPTHFASGDHLFFSARNQGDNGAAKVTRQDIAMARDEGWWGKPVTVSQEMIQER